MSVKNVDLFKIIFLLTIIIFFLGLVFTNKYLLYTNYIIIYSIGFLIGGLNVIFIQFWVDFISGKGGLSDEF